jgi:hypothetical protein
VNPLGAGDLRASFVNCSRGEAGRINLPANLGTVPWADLDYLGWRDPKAPQRAYLVVPWDGRTVGLTLRGNVKQSTSILRNSMCSICMTLHAASGVSIFAAPQIGQAGRDGSTIGGYWCSDLKCSLYARGIMRSQTSILVEETLDAGQRVARLRANLDQFMANVAGS